MKKGGIIGLYLAAGSSLRMGSNKLLLPFAQMPLGSLALSVALQSNLDDIFVITKGIDPLHWVHPSLISKKNKWIQLTSHDSELGQAYSLLRGIQKAKEKAANAVLIVLADQPFITIEMINQLIEKFQLNKDVDYVASSYQNQIQPPILISSHLFSELEQLKGDEGARRIIRHSEAIGIQIPYSKEKYFFDIDTVNDYNYALEIERRM